jgi:hypothetical protein
LLKTLDNILTEVYNIIVIKKEAGKERKMEENEMSKADLIAMLVSIREVARANGELKTVEHIDKILDEVRK